MAAAQRRVRRRDIERRPEMTLLVRVIIRLLLPIILVFGAYLVTYGHLTPGGGFQGGMTLVGALMIAYLAFGYESVRGYGHEALDLLEHVAALAYLIIGLLGILAGANFLSNILRSGEPGELLSGGIVLALSLVIGLKVAAGTLLVLLILLAALQKGDT
ncbi:MAG: MnhB domain-containing protein [Candidatus Promineifilaceae bacterium]